MPKEVLRTGYYATATKQVNHGDPCVENNIAGIALKQKTPAWNANYSDLKKITVGEDFLIRHLGTVEVPTLGGAAKGAAVYITTATNALTLTAPGAGLGFPFGRVVELAGQRGTSPGAMMVNMDLRDNINTP